MCIQVFYVDYMSKQDGSHIVLLRRYSKKKVFLPILDHMNLQDH